MWHNHFATSNLKVNDLAAMRRQNDIFREFARAPFGELLAARDQGSGPARSGSMRRPTAGSIPTRTWPASRWNSSRSAWAISPRRTSKRRPGRSPAGRTSPTASASSRSTTTTARKRSSGRKGRFRGDDFVAILLEQPATSRAAGQAAVRAVPGRGPIGRVAAGRTQNAEALVANLAAGLREHQLDIGWAVAPILRSQVFFDANNLQSRVLAPAEFAVGAARALQAVRSAAEHARLGRVDRPGWGRTCFTRRTLVGWSGGRAWYTTRSAIARANFATALVSGETVGLPGPLDPSALAARHGHGRRPGFLRTAAAGRRQSPEVPPCSAPSQRRAIARLLSDPEAQRA